MRAIQTCIIVAASVVAVACGSYGVAPPVAAPPVAAPPVASSPAAAPPAKPPAEPDSGLIWDERGASPHGGLPVHVALGVPRDADPTDDYLMDKGAYVVSYNVHLNAPNWVAWRLTKDDMGSALRAQGFHPDTALPPPFYRVKDADYRGTGYDRGHLCPSADRSSSPEANRATFFLTNVHPQLHDMNAGPWERLEAHVRHLAREGRDVYVVAGGVFAPDPPRIGHGVAVPRASYKVIVALPRGASVGDVDESSLAIAAVVPNRAGIARDPWAKYATTVRAVEEATGYDYLARLPRRVQDAIERAPPQL